MNDEVGYGQTGESFLEIMTKVKKKREKEKRGCNAREIYSEKTASSSKICFRGDSKANFYGE